VQAANRISAFNVDARDAGSLKQLQEQVQNQRVVEDGNTKTGRLVMQLKEIAADQTNITNPAEITNYISAMEKSLTESQKAANRSRASLNRQMRDFKEAVIVNPSVPIPSGFLDSLDEMELRLMDEVDEAVDVLQVLDAQYARNTELLAQRAENLTFFRRDDVAHLKQTTRNLELSLQNRLKRMKDRARRGFFPVDKKAAEAGVSVPITKMITELISYAPEEGGLSAFFSKNSRFFRGTLGKQVYKTATSMAERSLTQLGDGSFDKLKKLHMKPKTKGGKDNPYYIGTNPSPLDVLLFYLDPKNQEDLGVAAPDLLATPGEVMDVYAAFSDYAVRTGDDALASRYQDYAEVVAQTVKDTPGIGEELFKEWEKARRIYQSEWFDKLRQRGPLRTLTKSSDGPIKAVEKGEGKKLVRTDLPDELQDEDALDTGERITFDDVGVGEVIPENVLADRLTTGAYKTDTPDTIFNPMINAVEKAMKGDEDALLVLLRERDGIIQQLSDVVMEQGSEFVFDLDDPLAEADFKLLKGTLTEMVYAKWGKNVASQLNERISDNVLAESTGGYNFEFLKNIKQLQQVFRVAVKQDGKVIKAELVDFQEMIATENDIATVLGRAVKEKGSASKSDLEVLEGHKIWAAKTRSAIDQVADSALSNATLRDDGVALISRYANERNPHQFFESFVVNGDPKDFDSLVEHIISRTGPTVTKADGTTFDTVEAVERGIKYLMINGMMQYAGYAPVAGAKSKGMDGQEFTNHAMYNPEMLVAALEKENVQSILAQFLDEDSIGYVSDMAEMLSEENAYLQRATGIMRETIPTIVNKVRPFGPNSLIARGFNLARRMVSPQYVAAELAVNLALQSGLNLMELAAGNREAGELMIRLMRTPSSITKIELDTFSNMVTDFVISEVGGTGQEGMDRLKEMLELPPEEEE